MRFKRAILQLDLFWRSRFPLPRGKYLVMRLHNALYRAGVLQPEWGEVLPGTAMLVDSRDFIYRPFFLNQAYEPEVSSVIARHSGPGRVFLDIGANAGMMSLLAARRGSQVVAFEPNPAMAARIGQNAAHNGLAINVQQFALSDRRDELSLYVASADNTGRSSLSGQVAQDATRVTVQARRLDDLLPELGLPRVDLVKIDVEGAELQVLRGAEQTLRQFRPTVVIEIVPRQLAAMGTTPADIHAFFAALGYRPETIDEANLAFLPVTVEQTTQSAAPRTRAATGGR